MDIKKTQQSHGNSSTPRSNRMAMRDQNGKILLSAEYFKDSSHLLELEKIETFHDLASLKQQENCSNAHEDQKVQDSEEKSLVVDDKKVAEKTSNESEVQTKSETVIDATTNNDNEIPVASSEKIATDISRSSNNERKRMFCRMCGKEIPVDSKFCPYCGTKVIL